MKTIQFNPATSGTDDERCRVDIMRKLNMDTVQTAWDRHAERMAEDAKLRKRAILWFKIAVGFLWAFILWGFWEVTK